MGTAAARLGIGPPAGAFFLPRCGKGCNPPAAALCAPILPASDHGGDGGTAGHAKHRQDAGGDDDEGGERA